MSNTPEDSFERHANAALSGLMLMTAGTFALAIQNLRDLIEILGAGPLRVSLVALAAAAVLAFFAKAVTVFLDAFPQESDVFGRRAAVVLGGLLLGSVVCYATFVVIVIAWMRDPTAVAAL